MKVVFTLESQINTDYKMKLMKLMKVMKWNIEKYSREVSDETQSFIAEILLNKMNLYYRPWHVVVVDLLIMTQLFFILSYDFLDILVLRKSYKIKVQI